MPQQEISPLPPEGAEPAGVRIGSRVLKLARVVDDEEDARVLLQTTLRQYGADVEPFEPAEVAHLVARLAGAPTRPS